MAWNCVCETGAGKMSESIARGFKVLVLAPPLQAVGGIQNYIHTLFAALQNVLGNDRVRMVAVPSEPEQRNDGRSALRPFVKIRFFASAFVAAISWSPDLIICAHIGVAPAGRLIHKLRGVPYWVVLYGIEVWGELSPPKQKALRDNTATCVDYTFYPRRNNREAFSQSAPFPHPSSDTTKGATTRSRDSSHRFRGSSTTGGSHRWPGCLIRTL